METINGYTRKEVKYYVEKDCMLTIGSIIRFNGELCLVIHTDKTIANRTYSRDTSKGHIDTTKGFSGRLKNIKTNYEFRANWRTVTQDRIIYYNDVK